MKSHLRLSLPPLAQITPQSIMAFALLDRNARVMRSGELPLEQLADALPVEQVCAILHPHDAIVATIKLPPLPAKRMHDAVQSSVEPMALDDIAICVSPTARVHRPARFALRGRIDAR